MRIKRNKRKGIKKKVLYLKMPQKPRDGLMNRMSLKVRLMKKYTEIRSKKKEEENKKARVRNLQMKNGFQNYRSWIQKTEKFRRKSLRK